MRNSFSDAGRRRAAAPRAGLCALAVLALAAPPARAEWHKVNLHADPANADPPAAASDLAKAYRELGYRFVGIAGAGAPAPAPSPVPAEGRRRDRRPEESSFDVLGASLLAEEGKAPRLLALGLPGKPAGETLEEKAREAASKKSLLLLVYPGPSAVNLKDLGSLEGVRLLELYDGREKDVEGVSLNETLLDLLLTEGKRWLPVATDGGRDGASAGGGWIAVEGPPKLSYEGLRYALDAGRFYATSGVEIESLRFDGKTLTVASKNAEKILFIGEAGKILAEAAGKEGSFTLPQGQPYVRCRLAGPEGKRAWTRGYFASEPLPAFDAEAAARWLKEEGGKGPGETASADGPGGGEKPDEKPAEEKPPEGEKPGVREGKKKGPGGGDDKPLVKEDPPAKANEPPRLDLPLKLQAEIKKELVYPIPAFDPEKEKLRFSSSRLPKEARLSPDGKLTLNPTKIGEIIIPIKVEDPERAFAEGKLVIEVVDTENKAPILAPIENQRASVGHEFEYQLKAKDADADPLTFSAGNLPKGARLDARTGVFRFKPEQRLGKLEITFKVEDGRGGADEEEMDLSVFHDNRAPRLTVPAAATVTSGRVLTFAVKADDPDKDEVKISMRSYPAGATLNGGTFTYSPEPVQKKKTVTVSFLAADGGGLTDQRDVSITILPAKQ